MLGRATGFKHTGPKFARISAWANLERISGWAALMLPNMIAVLNHSILHYTTLMIFNIFWPEHGRTFEGTI